ncbi:MAG: hypothetical protein GMKNLPBB_02791 [Myxococcota bacterium]|nr:hypothetical protein [Myxococcota bacterium]
MKTSAAILMALAALAPRTLDAAPSEWVLGHPASGGAVQTPPVNVIAGDASNGVEMGASICAYSAPAGVSVQINRGLVKTDPAVPGAWVNLSLDASGGSCKTTVARRLFITGEKRFSLPEPPVTIHYDSGIVEVLSPAGDYDLLHIRDGVVARIVPCEGKRSCTLPLTREELEAVWGRERAGVLLWPSSIPLRESEPFPAWTDSTGKWVGWKQAVIESLSVELRQPVVSSSTLDATGQSLLLQLSFPRGVQDVSCRNARCSLTPDGVQVFAIESTALTVRMTVKYKPGVARVIEGRQVFSETVDLNVRRCAIRTPDGAPLLEGVASHQFFIAISRDCITGERDSLEVETFPPTNTWVRERVEQDDPSWRYYRLVMDRAPRDVSNVMITLSQRGLQKTVLGAVRIPVARGFNPVRLRFELPRLGAIDFIPSNREAQLEVVYEDPQWESQFVLEERKGFYEVRRDGGHIHVRADEGAAGSVALRFGYRPAALERFLGRVETLASFDTDARFSLRSLNLPAPIIPVGDGDGNIVRFYCRMGGVERQLINGQKINIHYNDRNSCRLVIDLKRIPPGNGVQKLRIAAPRATEIFTVSHRDALLTITINADDKKEYEQIAVSVAHDYGSGHYDLTARQNLGEAADFRVILGDRRIRVSASTSLPTGLFRFGSSADQGSVALSAGAVVRAMALYDDGAEFPVGLEAGMLGTDLSGKPQLSLVFGVGLGIPVLNSNTPLQTSFNIHAWLEYSPTRSGPESGSIAFLFGPSFTVGRFFTNF